MSKKILDLRKSTGLSQKKFAAQYGIPSRTVENWEEGTNKCPDYVFNLLERVVGEDLAAGKFKKSSEEA